MSSPNPSPLSSTVPALQQALREQGFLQATTVQVQAIEPIRQGRDLVVMAPTGSGKTLAFALPMLERWLGTSRRSSQGVAQLVLAPTRELAMQTADLFTALGRGMLRRPKVVLAVGGASINPQMMALRGGADIVVATPGRVLDLHAHNALPLSAVEVVVLDEADRLLDAGFGEEVGRILALLPARRQSLLFSATFPASLSALADAGLKDSLKIDARSSATEAAADITQRAIQVDSSQRTALLIHLLQESDGERALVFAASRRTADNVAGKLAKAGIRAHSLHGDHSNGTRVRVLREFDAGVLQVVVATDVAARGLDLTGLPLVVNYDLPRAAADYIHRIGRTGRAGASGQAISFVSAESEAHFRLIEKRQGTRVPREQLAEFVPSDTSNAAAVTSPDNGGIKGKRPSRKDRARAAAANGTPAG